jgi:ABC-type antimicrobial peptide transport system permease subunit
LLGFGGRQLFVRGRGNPLALAEPLRQAMRRLDPGIGYITVQMLQDSLDPQIRPWRLGATMFGLFGGLAVLVAAIGLYSVISYLVTQRTHELGVRIALGARPGSIVGLVVRYGVGLTVAGIVIGIVLALNAAGWIQPLLFDTSARNPVVFGGVALLLLAVAAVASVVPAWRASRVDPIEALRAE